MSNSSLIDLFRQESLDHIRTLADGLVNLERDPTNARVIEPLMRAAHSVKGAARVVDVEPAVKVAHALEECLVLAQKGKIRLEAAAFDVLLRGTELLRQSVTAAGPSLPNWMREHDRAVADGIKQLEAVAAGQEPDGRNRADRGDQKPDVSSGQQPASLLVATEPVPDKAVDWSAGGEKTPGPILAFFRQEVQRLASKIREGLKNPSAGDDLPALIADVYSLSGSARVAKVAPVIHLAERIEEQLQACQRDGNGMASGDLPGLLEACDWLEQVANAAGPTYSTWLKANGDQLRTLWTRLKPVVPKSQTPNPKSESPNPKSEIRNPKSESPVPAVPVPAVAEPAALAKVPAPTLALQTNERSEIVPVAEEQERVVRVTAQNLTRLMGLAGELLVEAHWLQPFANALLDLRRQQTLLDDDLNELIQHLPSGTANRSRVIVTDARQRLAHCLSVLNARIAEFDNRARTSDDLNSRLYREVIASRMRPFRDGVQGFALMVRNLARELGKLVHLEIVGEDVEVDRDILEKLESPLTHLLRNAIDHGVESPEERRRAGKPETARLVLEARHNAGMLAIQIRDDGRGIDIERLRCKVVERKLTTEELAAKMSAAELLEFLFLPGFSTRDEVTLLSGRGVGLDVVSNMVRGVGGTVRVRTELGQGTRFHLFLPLTLSVIRAVLVDIAGEPYAFALNRIDRLVRLPSKELRSLENRQYFQLDGRNVGVVVARQVLELEGDTAVDGDLYIVIFSNDNDQYGLVVDHFLGEHDLVVRPLDMRLGKVPDINATAILNDGSPVLMIDLDSLQRSVEKLLLGGQLRRTDWNSANAVVRKKRVLVVDDSITVREAERQMLSLAGYEVETAVDGLAGWNALASQERLSGSEYAFDLVVSDVDMPGMDGLALTRLIKSDARLGSTPIILVSYKDRADDHRKGLEAGANYYLTKSSFQDDTFLKAVRELIGEPEQ